MSPAPDARRDRTAAIDPMPAALRSVSSELNALAQAAEGLQVPIVKLILLAGPAAAASHPELQNLDLLTQSLKALSLFTERLAAGEARGPAAENLGLADLEGRLAGRAPISPQGHTGRGGVCVLFQD